MGDQMSFGKRVLLQMLIGAIIVVNSYGWSQMGPPDGEGFILFLANSGIESFEDLNHRKICGSYRSFEAFRSHTGVNNAVHVEIPYSEGVPAMKMGSCDAAIAYSTDLGKIREIGEMWRRHHEFKILIFP